MELQSLNLFTYVTNNPIMFIDLSGYIAKWLKGIGVILVIVDVTVSAIAGGMAIIGGGSVILADIVIGSGFVVLAGTYLWGFDELMAIGEFFADIFIKPDKRCCGGSCERNNTFMNTFMDGIIKFDPEYIRKLKQQTEMSIW